VLGLTSVETGEAPDWQRLYERREPWQIGTVPSGGLFLTARADVQKDRIEVDVWAWGRALESLLVDHIIIQGGPERAESWNALHRLLGQTWQHTDGAQLGLAKFAIDTMNRPPCTLGLVVSIMPTSRRLRASRASTARRRYPSDACRRDRGRQKASPRPAVMDDRCRDIQERDLSAFAPEGAERAT
jgi:phage terminase large subunit GpA-like protein